MPQPDDDNREDTFSGIEKALDNIGESLSNTFKNFSAGKTDASSSVDPSMFFRAVKSGKTELVRAFLSKGMNPDAVDSSGDTALHIAARNNKTPDVVRVLLDAGADPLKTGGNDALTPLETAVNYGNVSVVDVLAREGGYSVGHKVDGWSMLHRACKKGKPAIVAALLAAGADANDRTDNGSTPLLIAVQQRLTDLALALLDFPDVVRGMNEYHAATDQLRRSAFMLAVERGDQKVIRKMLENGADVNAKDAAGNTPLHNAIVKGDPDIVALLVQFSADVNRGKVPPLVLTCQTPEIRMAFTKRRIVDILLDAGADADLCDKQTGMTALHAALLSRDGADAASSLIAAGANTEIYDHDGMTPIFYALSKPQEAILQELIDKGANIEARERQGGRTPLVAAAYSMTHPHAVKTLLDAGADARAIDAEGNSAMYYLRKTGADRDYAGLVEQKLASCLKPSTGNKTSREFDL